MKNLANTGVLFVCLAVVVGAFAFTADELGLYLFGLKWPLHCMMDSIFGVKCAFCGLTRSFTAMAHGDAAQAFGHHHVGPLLFLFAAVQIPYRMWLLAISPERPGRAFRRVHATVAAFVLGAIFVNWLIYLGGHLP